MSKDESAVKLANIIRSSELHNRSTLDMDELYEEVADIVKDIYDAGFGDVGELRKWLRREKDNMLKLTQGQDSNIVDKIRSQVTAFEQVLDKLESL